MTETAAPALTIETTAYGATVTARFDTPQDAAAFAARFPKAAKLTAPSLNGYTVVGRPGHPERGMIRVHVKLTADGVNGGVNETGLRRLATIRRAAAKLGVEVIES